MPRKKRGDRQKYPPRSHSATADFLHRAGDGEPPSQFKTQGLCPVYQPFWADLPHTDIFACITPDILHQIHKGVVKDHLLPWLQKIVGEKALDECFAAMPESHGLRHFKRGVSLISQWTGGEAKELEKLLLGALAGRASSDIQKAARGLLDFTYYAQYQVHSEDTLAKMQHALNTFHRHKHGFIKAGIRDHFNIPKVHSLLHYVDAIRQVGCLDGVNTETSERLHIDYAKKAYRASSRREYFAQMTTWLQRQEAIERRDTFLAWSEGRLEEDMRLEALRIEEEEAEESGEGADELAGGGWQDDVDVAGEDVDIGALRKLVDSNVSRAFQLPLTPAVRRVTPECLASAYGAHDFLLELNEFLTSHPDLHAHRLTTTIGIEVYHAITVLLPPNIHIANQKRVRKVRASPAIPRQQDRQPVPQHFDCGLFVQDEDLYSRERGLHGEYCDAAFVIHLQMYNSVS